MSLRVLVLASCLFLGSCARLPAAGSESTATRITFNFTTADPINPAYIYVVAIRVLDPPVGTFNNALSDPNQGPSPVIAGGSKNGIVGGLPTHYIVYTETTPNLYQVYRFFLNQAGELPDSSDPAPINLSLPGQYIGDVLPGTQIDPRPTTPGGDYGNQLGFTIDTSYLSQHSGSQPINTIQFNIFAMNKPESSSGTVSGRVMDAIGNQSDTQQPTFNNPYTLSLLSGRTIYDYQTSVPETTGDTLPNNASLPAVDLKNWTVTVTRP